MQKWAFVQKSSNLSSKMGRIQSFLEAHFPLTTMQTELCYYNRIQITGSSLIGNAYAHPLSLLYLYFTRVYHVTCNICNAYMHILPLSPLGRAVLPHMMQFVVSWAFRGSCTCKCCRHFWFAEFDLVISKTAIA